MKCIGKRVAGLVGLAMALACTRPAEPAVLRVATAPLGSGTLLTLQAEPHIKISARLAPALELGDGTILRFSADRLTPDSAYFAAPPVAMVPERLRRIRGTLRASVCRDDELVCRSVTIEL
jgi:hypothetical protein